MEFNEIVTFYSMAEYKDIMNRYKFEYYIHEEYGIYKSNFQNNGEGFFLCYQATLNERNGCEYEIEELLNDEVKIKIIKKRVRGSADWKEEYRYLFYDILYYLRTRKENVIQNIKNELSKKISFEAQKIYANALSREIDEQILKIDNEDYKVKNPQNEPKNLLKLFLESIQDYCNNYLDDTKVNNKGEDGATTKIQAYILYSFLKELGCDANTTDKAKFAAFLFGKNLQNLRANFDGNDLSYKDKKTIIKQLEAIGLRNLAREIESN